PAINDTGSIAVAGSGGLYSISGTTITPIATSPTYFNLYDPSINDQGVVADYSENGSSGYSYIIAGSGGPGAEMPDSSDPRFANGFRVGPVGADVWINDSGEVVFGAYANCCTFGDWIGDGTSVTPVPSSIGYEGGASSLNDSGVDAHLFSPLDEETDI